MDSIGTVLTSLLTFSIGVGMGMLIHRIFFYQKSSESLLRKQVDELLANQKLYKDQVSAHFDKTSALFNEVTTSYKTLHDHFKNSSMQLNNQTFNAAQITEISDDSGDRTYRRRAAEIGVIKEDEMETPLDYAPKSAADEVGQLTEGYGLNNEDTQDLPAQSPDFSSHEEQEPHIEDPTASKV